MAWVREAELANIAYGHLYLVRARRRWSDVFVVDVLRRRMLKLTAGAGGLSTGASAFPSIVQALVLPAARATGTIGDVEHVVILMLENRAFDHYFGTLRGVRGFADRNAPPLAGGKPVWSQSDGQAEVWPFHLDSATTSALKVRSTPHSFASAQAAWNQGRFGAWAQVKTPISMGHYRREDIPFQFALAEAFTLCDAYHCSVTTGTDPNRIVFWSGSNADPDRARRGEACTDAHAEPDNLRCWVKGALPEPGYAYQGSSFAWPTIPEVLQQAAVSWRIYQDPNDNWTGAMHGGLAFESFRKARPGSPLYENGMRHWSLAQLAQDVKTGRLPQVSWILPSQSSSEHPAGSSPMQGAELTSQVLDALTADPKVWARAVLFVTFDENDGLFDHAPPPAPPSYDQDGALAGKSTVTLEGMYFSDLGGKYRHPQDPYDGELRAWGLGPRVPMYVVSPWSKGGWVDSQVFDHTSVGQFIERRFGVTIPAISPWRRAVCGDLTSAFDFAGRSDPVFPSVPRVRNAAALAAAAQLKPAPAPPARPERLWQEPGVRRARGLPYDLQVDSALAGEGRAIDLEFRNDGRAGAVFHVYDRLRLDRIPRRYTVEAGKVLSDRWRLDAEVGRYDLWVLGPNDFVREFRGGALSAPGLEISARGDSAGRAVRLALRNSGETAALVEVRANAYRPTAPQVLTIAPGRRVVRSIPLASSHDWYDIAVKSQDLERRFAGRLETGAPGISNPHHLSEHAPALA
jgi:phospholipase C